MAPSFSYFQKTVTLVDWWLTKPQSDHLSLTLGVAGLTSQQNRPIRCFSSAPILKVFDLFELETVDGVCVILQGFINEHRTLNNGFSPQVFEHFYIGFPPNWKDYCPKIEYASKCVTRVQEEDGEDSIEENCHFHGKPRNSDGCAVDMGGQDCEDMMFNDKSSTPLNPSSVKNPHEHIVEDGNEVVCEKSSVPSEFKDGPRLESSPIVSNTFESFTQSKCLGVSSRRMTRSMKKLDNSKNSFPPVNDISNLDKGTLVDPGILGSPGNLKAKAVNFVDCDMKSKRRNIYPKSSGGYGKGSDETVSCSEDTVIKIKSQRKPFAQTADVITKDKRNKDNADISGESEINMRTSDLEDVLVTPKCSDSLCNTSVDVTDVNDNIVIVKTNMEGCRKQRNKVDIPQKKGVSATHGTSSKETVINRNRSRTKLPVKRKLITSPESAKSTSLRGKKGSEERCGSANILSIESFSGKKSRSGRVVLPPLEFWRNQKVVYDEDREMCGVQEPK
ncbi:hypothetical protein M8C21_020896 [Ambrosia artemisiifolia]|uniref:SANTA domain-containing protein n=1 Tax=Ambrosia artemisiifolia TaxID=4212 RepID=A0AAD5CQ81_AMBAR|nr:hypothetical protein M8C21_020896 [Ambrosia artemisiifolia]